MPSRSFKVKPFLLLGLAAGVYFLLYGFRLSFPPKPYYDEIYHALLNENSLHLGPYYSGHPPLGDLFILFFTRIFGNDLWVYRLAPLLAGFGCLTLVYGIADKLFKNKRLAFFSAFFFLLDGLSMTQARITMLNSMMLFWMLSSVNGVIGPPAGIKNFWRAVILSGVFFGLALATRAVALMILPVLVALAIKKRTKGQDVKYFWAGVFLCFFVLPLLVYFGVFFLDAFIRHYDLSWIWKFQEETPRLNLYAALGHPYGSDWWTWPLMLRPIWYFFESPSTGAAVLDGILCIGNPAIFWIIPMILGYSIYHVFKERSWALGLVMFGFLCQWLPWAFVGRVKFFHYFYTAMPFLAILLGFTVEKVWNLGRSGKGAALLYLFSVLALFIYWYPLWTGFPISESYYHAHLWLDSWL